MNVLYVAGLALKADELTHGSWLEHRNCSAHGGFNKGYE